MKAVELALAGLFVLGGLRSLWKWSRRHFESTDVEDHVLYALYLTGRIGLWFAIAGFFLIYAATGIDGKATSELSRYRWYFLVPLVLSALQLVAGYFLGRRASD